jgi:hypothetical protein
MATAKELEALSPDFYSADAIRQHIRCMMAAIAEDCFENTGSDDYTTAVLYLFREMMAPEFRDMVNDVIRDDNVRQSN